MTYNSYGINSFADKFSCIHIEEYKKTREGKDVYKFVYDLFVTCIDGHASTTKAKECKCEDESCKSKRLLGCLDCVFFGCFKEHFKDHFKKVEHFLAIDVNSGHVYCFKCEDFKYDDDFEEIAKKQKIIAATERPYVAKYFKYVPTMKESEILLKVQLSETYKRISPKKGQILGLRGIYDSGNICYITVILQSLLHAPIIRDYFLSDEHEKICDVYAQKQNTGNNAETICFSCEIGEVVQEFYSGKNKPYGLGKLLYLIFKNASGLEGNEMNDCHEFLVFLIHQMHKCCEEKKNHNHCIMDKIFMGSLQGGITCKCRTVAPIMDTFKSVLTINLDKKKILVDTQWTLEDAIEKYTQTKYETVSCSNCETVHKDYLVQKKFKKLPVILIFQINRKISGDSYDDSIIQFSEDLDMTPYVSYCVNKNGHNSERVNYNKFNLFAVVNYYAVGEGGHYTCYVRMHDKKWYLCDTSEITCVEERENIPAYMLFYHKEYLEYKFVDNMIKE